MEHELEGEKEVCKCKRRNNAYNIATSSLSIATTISIFVLNEKYSKHDQRIANLWNHQSRLRQHSLVTKLWKTCLMQ